MKTAISIPDPVFRSAEQLAKRLKVSRSQLYATAVADYVGRNQRSGVTEKLDEVHGAGPEGLDPALAAMQSRSLRRERW
jgi:predicted transcriptional regulator